MIEAYPCYWPEGKPKTKYRTSSKFKTTFGMARDQLLRELELLRASEPIISTNIALRRDGLPYASAGEPSDPSVAVYFKYKGRQHCFACDKWSNVRENIQAIRLTIQALRGITRWGSGDMMEQAFRGFAQLSAPIEASASWWETLGVSHRANSEEVRAAYLAKMRVHHPDVGGKPEMASKINEAYEAARKDGRG